MKICLAMEDTVAVFTGSGDQWRIVSQFHFDSSPTCLAIDSAQPEHVYCGTMDHGLWYSDNAGVNWRPVAEGIVHRRVTAVAVSPKEWEHDGAAVWAGTEPSALFVSEDGGNHWTERRALQDLPSKPTWSFPPRPWTHHVRWIEPDRTHAGRLFVAIERGGVMRSVDYGVTWEDRKPGSQLDGHTIQTLNTAPDHVFEAAGGESFAARPRLHLGWPPVEMRVFPKEGGYAESRDGGVTWETRDEGLSQHYLWSIAVDPGNPETMIASGAPGPFEAHRASIAESFLLRKSNGEPWRKVCAGLPPEHGTLISVVAANEAEPGVFYAANNRGIFCSGDGGESWQELNLPWPDDFRSQHVQGMVLMPESGG
ncbi:WD40/YVTN/BNR-like repeat-containing protein [Verrucomicrobiota bacterium sgz303538]